MANPTLQLIDSQGTVISANNNWQDGPDSTEIASKGLAPRNDKESALLAIPAPGSYTAVVKGVNNSVGVGLVEVYRLQ